MYVIGDVSEVDILWMLAHTEAAVVAAKSSAFATEILTNKTNGNWIVVFVFSRYK